VRKQIQRDKKEFLKMDEESICSMKHLRLKEDVLLNQQNLIFTQFKKNQMNTVHSKHKKCTNYTLTGYNT